MAAQFLTLNVYICICNGLDTLKVSPSLQWL